MTLAERLAIETPLTYAQAALIVTMWEATFLTEAQLWDIVRFGLAHPSDPVGVIQAALRQGGRLDDLG